MKKNEIAVFAGGCFWCTEAVFKRLKGVKSIVPGYSGGNTENPTYDEVSSGKTGHAEAIKIEFNPEEISFSKLLDVFWNTHDPTTINRQGNDIGTQYRSTVFYCNKKQKEEAEKLKEKLDKEKIFEKSIVTEIVPFTNFYEAEDYHKNYYEKHESAPYCNFVIAPKLRKLLEKYQQFVK